MSGDMTLGRLLTTVALVATFGVPAAAGQGHSKFDESLRESIAKGCKGTKSVIIRTQPGAREALRKSLAAQGRRVNGEFPALDAITVEVSCADLHALAGFGETASISDNANIHGHQLLTEDTSTDTLTVTDEPLLTEETVDDTTLVSFDANSSDTTVFSSSLLSRLQEAYYANQLQGPLFSTLLVRTSLFSTLETYRMPSVGVAIIDSGIAPGIDFGSRITAFYDFTYGDIRATSPSDEYGHGSHVAGLAAGTFVGIAPAARLIGLKVLDAKGQGTTDNVIRAIEFAIVNKDVLNIDVINLSLGHPIFESAATDPLVQAVEHASRAGIKVVVSAGNFGRNPVTGEIGYAGTASPGNAPSGISVGSVRTFNTVTRDDDRLAPYSSRGPSWYDGFAKPDISAPGDNLLSVAAVGSTLRLVQEQRGNVGNYMRLSGTSMAAGVVSGMVATILQHNPTLTPNALKMVLQYSSIPVKQDDGTYYNALTQGAGSLNGGAVALARAINPAATLGSEWLTANVTPSSTIGGQTYVWAQRMIWGNHIARGTGVITEQRPAWALDIVWGDGLEDDDNIVWGNLNDDDNIVWGNALDLDDNIVWGNNLVWANSQDDDDNVVWGNLLDDDNIVWGNFDDDNIVWGNNVVWGNALIGINDGDNIVWGNLLDDDNIVWGNLDDDNIVWGNLNDDNIVWGNSDDDNIVWGNFDDDNIVWGNSALLGKVLRTANNRGQVKKLVHAAKGVK
jgi:serine protease AprX